MIQNCNTYNSLFSCIECAANYSLEDGKCLLNNVPECLIHRSSTSCSVCNQGFGLEEKDNNFICVSIPKIDKCLQYDQKDFYVCAQCDTGLYFNGSQCVGVLSASLVTQCNNYDKD